MKKRGSALIYVLIIMIPVLSLSLALIETATANYRISCNVVLSRQAQYNAEAGLIYAAKLLESCGYDEYYIMGNNEKIIIYDDALEVMESRNYTEIFISFFNGVYRINSKGHFMNFTIQRNISIDK